MRILGVDPGTIRTGAAIIEAQGSRYSLLHSEILKAKPDLPIQKRLAVIYQGLVEVIHRFKPAVISLENVFFGKDPRALIKLGEARGCILLAASELGLSVIEYPPSTVKRAVTGQGHATKDQMQQMVKRLLNLSILPASDSADAMAIAICHLHQHRTTTVLAQAEAVITKSVKISLSAR